MASFLVCGSGRTGPAAQPANELGIASAGQSSHNRARGGIAGLATGDDVAVKPQSFRRFVAVALALLAAIGMLAGPAAGAAPRTWHLVALGDSIPYGGRYCGYCTPYPSLLALSLAHQSGHPVAVTNLGFPGITTAELLVNVHTQPDIRLALAAADVVTITIGHNDTPWNSLHDSCDGVRAWFGRYRDAQWSSYAGACLTKDANALRARLASLLVTVRALRRGQPTLIVLTTDWNQVIGAAGITALARQALKAVLDRFALEMCAAARAASARCGDVYHAFNGPGGTLSAASLLASDHDHASQKGHQAIATLLARFGYAPLVR